MPYLDHNATAPVLPEVAEALGRALVELPGNAHSQHAAGRAAAAAVEQARDRVAAAVGRPASLVRFTSGATEANAWALSGRTGAVLVSAVEHDSVRAWGDREIPVDGDGMVDLDALDRALAAGDVAVVSVMAANNETGVLQPIDQVHARCAAAGVPLHCDATQLLGRMALDLPAELLTLSFHKAGGPKGIGVLVGSPLPPPLLRGGPQERGGRAGTVAVPLVVAAGVAAERATWPGADGRRAHLQAGVEALGGTVLGRGAPRLPNTVTALFDVPGDLLVMGLDLRGVAASTGAACASGAAQESHVVRAMGRSGLPLRLSFGPTTAVDELDQALAALSDVLRTAREVA
ncbi:MAG: aminotransferase class V-fold PLP-dependent enzyme [Alphaproteobacteria bacterium]|nr:aminotransferase class V-fold PLP-dependent enzyme [Alphaproteobacteria bacterium]